MLLADLALYDRYGQLVAAVEVKAKVGTTGDWATRLWRNIATQDNLSDLPYFLLATPETLYLWKRDATQKGSQPTHQIDLHPVLAPYFQRAGVDPQSVSGFAFELIVASWLNDLTHNSMSGESNTAPGGLTESGFLDTVREGRVEYQAAA